MADKFPMHNTYKPQPANVGAGERPKLGTLEGTAFDPSELPGAGKWGGPPEEAKDVTNGITQNGQ